MLLPTDVIENRRDSSRERNNNMYWRKCDIHFVAKISNVRQWNNKHSGEELDELIPHYRLIILNKTGNAPTFGNTHGQSNIDVTIATKAIAKKVRNWRVHSHKINSDHSLITFEIACTNQEIHTKSNNRFNTKRADWDTFRAHISQSLILIPPHPNANEGDAQTRSEHIESYWMQAKKPFRRRVYTASLCCGGTKHYVISGKRSLKPGTGFNEPEMKLPESAYSRDLGKYGINVHQN